MKRAVMGYLCIFLPLIFALTVVLGSSLAVHAQSMQVIAPEAGPYESIGQGHPGVNTGGNVSANYTSGTRIYLTDYMKGTPGVFTSEADIESGDGMLRLAFPAGTRGQTKEGWALSYITLDQTPAGEQSPPPPAGGSIIGPAYQLGPEGTSFSPSITVTIQYDRQSFPRGMNESGLVIGYWDIQNSRWVALTGSLVDMNNSTVSAPLSHFSTYAILGYPPAPPTFSVSNLSVSPAEASPGQDVTVDAVVTNTGGSSGNYLVLFKLDGVVLDNREVILNAGESAPVEFKVNTGIAGKHEVDLNGSTGQFILSEPQGTIAGLPSTAVPAATSGQAAVNTPAATPAKETPVPASEGLPGGTIPLLWMVSGAAAAFVITLAITLTIKNKNGRV